MPKTKQDQKAAFLAHKRYLELEAIVEQMADAMRRAHMPHIATSGRFTPGMDAIWNRYIAFAQAGCRRREMSTTCVVYEEA